MEVRPERILDPYKPQTTLNRYLVAAVIGFGIFASIAVTFFLVTGRDFGRVEPAVETRSQHYASFFKSYGMEPVPDGLIDAAVDAHLSKLAKEPCDWDAMHALGEDLKKRDEKRRAANIYLTFPQSCQPNGLADREAANLFYSIKDFKRARELFVSLTKRFPYQETDWYHKGQAEHALGMVDEALESFENTISLTKNQANIGEWVFAEMSEIYASAGRYCEAMTPIATYIYLDPTTRDTPRERAMLASFSEKGKCTSYATGSDSFPVLNSGTISVRANVNGIEGTFVIDTGASYVSVNRDFADRAKIATNGTQRVVTANGEANVEMSKAATIRLGKLRADDVPLVVLSKPMNKLDGLLGRSFLSRFEMTVTKSRLTLKTK
jgi:aspartyl protease family protein